MHRKIASFNLDFLQKSFILPYFCKVKKTLFVITLFIVVKPILPFVEYVVDYEYISTVLCINKEKPEMKCNGKCHLMKQLAKAAEEEKPISEKKSAVKEIELLFFQELPEITFTNAVCIQQTPLNYQYTNLYHYLGNGSVFHPPTAII